MRVLSDKLRDLALFKRLKACLDANVFSMYIGYTVHLGPVVRKENRVIGFPNVYLVDGNLSGPSTAIHGVNHFPVNNTINFRITYPLDSDLSAG